MLLFQLDGKLPCKLLRDTSRVSNTLIELSHAGIDPVKRFPSSDSARRALNELKSNSPVLSKKLSDALNTCNELSELILEGNTFKKLLFDTSNHVKRCNDENTFDIVPLNAFELASMCRRLLGRHGHALLRLFPEMSSVFNTLALHRVLGKDPLKSFMLTFNTDNTDNVNNALPRFPCRSPVVSDSFVKPRRAVRPSGNVPNTSFTHNKTHSDISHTAEVREMDRAHGHGRVTLHSRCIAHTTREPSMFIAAPRHISGRY